MPASAGAAQWNVNNDTELRYALINAGNSDLLNLTSNVTVIGSDLPAIVKNLTINGNNRVLSCANQYRRLFAYSGSSLIANLNIGQTLARGGSGGSGRSAGGGAGLAGGRFVAAGASVSIANVQFFSNSAAGGTGGSENLGIPGEVGGGGMGGNGSSGSRSGGGGVGSAAHGGGRSHAKQSWGSGDRDGRGTRGDWRCAWWRRWWWRRRRGHHRPSTNPKQRRRFWCRPIGSLRGRWRRGNGRRSVCDAGRIADDRGKHDPIWRQRVGGSAGNVAIRGSTGQNGSAFGAGMFLQGNGSFSFSPEAAQTQSFADTIADQSGSGGTGANAGSWAVVKSGAGTLRLGGGNTYTGATQLAADTLQIASSAALGSAGALAFSGGTLQVTAAAGTLARGVTFNAGAARFQVDSGANLTLA